MNVHDKGGISAVNGNVTNIEHITGDNSSKLVDNDKSEVHSMDVCIALVAGCELLFLSTYTCNCDAPCVNIPRQMDTKNVELTGSVPYAEGDLCIAKTEMPCIRQTTTQFEPVIRLNASGSGLNIEFTKAEKSFVTLKKMWRWARVVMV